MDEDFDDTITLKAGRVEYSVDEAAVPLQDLIDTLLAAQSEGATRVVFLSENYRGAQYVTVPTGYDWLSDLEVQ